MTSAASGAVFFLGTRAHYQVLQPPETRYDAENGNDSTETVNSKSELWKSVSPVECGNWISCARSERSTSEIMLLEYGPEAPYDNSGVTRRKKKTEDVNNDQDMAPATLNHMNCRDSIKSKDSVSSTRCASLKALLANLKSRRKHKLSLERLDNIDSMDMCTYKDFCRCLDCQSRYFECDESDSEYSVSSGNYNDYDYTYELEYRPPTPAVSPVDVKPSTSHEDARDDEYDDENDEVFIDTPPDNASTDLLINDEGKQKSPVKEKMSVGSDEVAVELENPLDLEMAAGTPVVLDYLLNHPITCCIQ